MFRQATLHESLKSIPQHCATGPRMELSTASDCPVENDCTISNSFSASSCPPLPLTASASQSLASDSSTLASRLNTKKRTSNVKSKISNKRTRITKSSKTSVRVLTGSDPDCSPFWNERTTTLSKKLSSHIATGFADSEWSSWNGYSRSMASGCSFTTGWKRPLTQPPSWPTTYWQSRTTSWQRTTDAELHRRSERAKQRNKGQTKAAKTEECDSDIKPFAAIKIPMPTTPDQRALLTRWLGVYRWTYNQCCALVNLQQVRPSLKHLRARVVNISGIKEFYSDQSDWILAVPYDWRDKAVVEFVTGYHTQRYVMGKAPGDFKMRFKSRKALNQVCEIDVKHWHCGKPFVRSWGSLPRLRFLNRVHRFVYFIDRPELAVKIMYVRSKRSFMLILPRTVEFSPRRPTQDVVFFDPGVRTFLTGYDSQGRVLELGVGYESLLEPCQQMDKLCSAANNQQAGQKRSKRARYNIRNRRLPRMRQRLKNQVADFHSKVARFACENYSDIHLPIFDTARMLNKQPVRCINSKTARMMCTWSHYKFQQLLRYRARTTGAKVHIANEAYTSRTCCMCGNIKPKSSSKISSCTACGSRMDRDINGAVNIMLRQCTFDA